MSKYINPICVQPLYIMNDPEESVTCGNINGFLWAMIVSIFILIISYLDSIIKLY